MIVVPFLLLLCALRIQPSKSYCQAIGVSTRSSNGRDHTSLDRSLRQNRCNALCNSVTEERSTTTTSDRKLCKSAGLDKEKGLHKFSMKSAALLTIGIFTFNQPAAFADSASVVSSLPSSPIPTAPIPSTPMRTNPIPSAPMPTPPLPRSPLPRSPLPSSPLPSSPIPSSPLRSSPLPSSPLPSSPIPSTPKLQQKPEIGILRNRNSDSDSQPQVNLPSSIRESIAKNAANIPGKNTEVCRVIFFLLLFRFLLFSLLLFCFHFISFLLTIIFLFFVYCALHFI